MQQITPHQAKYFAYKLSLKDSGLNNLSYSLMNADVDLNPHQIEAAVFALNHPKGVILADEVGLGKTIEAGLVLTQLWAEGRTKLLVICPAMLRTQWKQELEDKFHLPVVIADSSNFHNLPDGHVHILSYHFASSVYEELAAVEWNYVVLDEAHRLRNLYQEDSVIAKNIFNAVHNRRKALLTATPPQNSLMELYSLITFIDDTVFSSPESFWEQYGYGFNQDKLKERIQPYIKRTLRRDVLEYIRYTERRSIVCRYKPSPKEAELYAKVSEYRANCGVKDETLSLKIGFYDGQMSLYLTDASYEMIKRKCVDYLANKRSVSSTLYTFKAMHNIPAYGGVYKQKRKLMHLLLKLAKKHHIALSAAKFDMGSKLKRYKVYTD